MGIKHSKHIDKRYRVRGNFQRVRWQYEDELPINDPMNDPSYNLQGEPDENSEDDTKDNVWIPRGEITTLDDETYDWYDSGEFLYRETVLQGTLRSPDKRTIDKTETVPKSLQQDDHYDVIDESDLDQSDTELKQITSDYKTNDCSNVYHKFPKHRANYEQMVRIFQPLIEKNVNVKRLLPYLPFLSNVEKIRAIEERDPHAAIIYLIDELCSDNSAEPGRWKQFIQALEKCGYKYIVDTLRGSENIDHTYQRQYLKIIAPELRQLIEPYEILLSLWACDVISSEDKEEVIRTERMFGPLCAIDKLLDMVPRRHKFWYSHLIDALTKAGRNEAADMLAIPEILDFGGDNVEKDIASEKNVQKEHPADITTSDYLEMLETEQYEEEDQTQCKTYLNSWRTDQDCENDEIDDLYLKMRIPDNNQDSTMNSFDNSCQQSIDHEEIKLSYEEYNPTETIDVYKTLDEDSLKDPMCSIPPSLPPRKPTIKESNDYPKRDDVGLEVDRALELGDDSDESDSVEVIRLTTPKPRKYFFPEHIPNHSNKVKKLNKQPVPAPRNRNSLSQKINKSFPTQNNDQINNACADKSGTPNTELEDHSLEENPVTQCKAEGRGQTEEAIVIPKSIIENEEKTDKFLKRVVCSKSKATCRKRKNKFNFKKTKINRRRQSLNTFSNAVFQNQGKVIALKNRERLAQPDIQKHPKTKADENFVRSTSLPTNIDENVECQDVAQAFGTPEKLEEYDDFSYSEPFRCFRGKEDEDIFVTIEQLFPGSKPQTKKTNFFNFPCDIQQRDQGTQETDELLDILESCNNDESKVDLINLKSNVEIKEVTKHNMKPELKQSLEKVRDLEAKLNHEVHTRKVLRRILQLQGDVNEVLKQKRETLHQLNMKEKEAEALEAAMTGVLYDVSESADVEECQNQVLPRQVDICSAVNNKLIIDRECLIEHEEQRITVNKLSNVETVKGDIFNDKDSAFCSEFTTKL